MRARHGAGEMISSEVRDWSRETARAGPPCDPDLPLFQNDGVLRTVYATETGTIGETPCFFHLRYRSSAIAEPRGIENAKK